MPGELVKAARLGNPPPLGELRGHEGSVEGSGPDGRATDPATRAELGAGIRGPSTDPEQQMGGSRDLAVVQPLEAFS